MTAVVVLMRLDVFISGTYPNCELCGGCFDNWALKIDTIGLELAALYEEALRIWHHYGKHCARTEKGGDYVHNTKRWFKF